MTKTTDYKALCFGIANENDQVAVLHGNNPYGRPQIGMVAVLNVCQVNINGRAYWGLVCASFTTQEVKWYSYNDIVGFMGGGQVQLAGLDRCLSVRYCWMDRLEMMQTREIVRQMVEDAKP